MSPTSDWSRDESRYIDGELDAADASRLEAELENASDRTARLRAWEDAMDVWRDDARRRSKAFDAGAVSQAVLARVQSGEAASDPALPSLRRYAAAAVLLLGLGTAGAAWLGPHPDRRPMLSSSHALRLLEAGQLVQHERLALTTYPQPAAPRPETER